MNCADNYHELLLYLQQAEVLCEAQKSGPEPAGCDINEAFEKSGAPQKAHPLPKIEEERFSKNSSKDGSHSDPEDIEVNLQILLKLDEAIRSDLSELLKNHNFNENDLSDYRFYKNNSFLNVQNGFHFDDEMDALSDLSSHSPSTTNAATQTPPSPSDSSTNLTSSYPGSDTESSEGSDLWGLTCPKRTLNSGKSNSAPVLEKVSPSLQVSRQSRSQSDRHLAEIEAAEACKWLRATGFPQYAQMYEDMQFPIDISQAAQDHSFLENDVLHSLFRRLKILNSCAHLHQQRVTHTDESDDECCALSENWTYQSDVRRWSRTCAKDIPNLEEISKRLESCSVSSQDRDDVFEKSSTQSPRERLKRGGSSKFRRRREGMCFSERENFNTVSPVGSLKTLELNHVSDSEITPKHQRKIRTKSFDKTENWGHTPMTVDRLVWQKLSECQESHVEDDINQERVPKSHLSAIQMQVLRKLALLKLTAHMEKYCPSHRTGWNWDLPKFIRKMKAPVYKDKNVFGVPLTITLQRTGQVLPRNIEEALRWLQLNAADQVGIFRKPGVKSRIQALRTLVENSISVDYSDQQSYDVADMVKQYFRDLPEILLTNKLSETFILIFQHVPVALRREAVLCALLLMPDEHVEVLQALLHFLLSVAKHSEANQMNESNLAMCFAPSLFHYSQAYKQNVGTPHPKELAENKAGYECLYYFLKNFDTLFKVRVQRLTRYHMTLRERIKTIPLQNSTNNHDITPYCAFYNVRTDITVY
ncbi:hypothetical protein ABEB36_010947 [Hypothenemus hampei]|uniref:Rho-GAP domain-containing protein n=2 Tax=Hypothenemus hampei TaxID=57062 RepID=A0ABD1EDM2_HYPHA